MNYSSEFKDLVESSIKKKINYIGKGNPNSKILIIGKELALPQDNLIAIEKTSEQNAFDWENNIENPNNKIEDCLGDYPETINLFNPLIPYKGMGFNPKKPAETWRKYQYLYDQIFNLKSKTYNFYKKIFITELNANPSKYSYLQKKDKRSTSINERKNNFFNSKFILNFPVIIVACGHYPKDNNVDLCELFNVEFKETLHVNENPKYWYNLHRNIQGEKPKLLIHTLQLSGSIKNEFLDEIANKIKSFANENKIEL